MNNTVADSVSEELLRGFSEPAPRYTSYPGTDRFVEAFSAQDYTQALTSRRSSPAAMQLPLSLYVHVPFCESLCYHCTSNKIITRDHERAKSYLQYLTREVELTVSKLGGARNVGQLHLGGGTPTFLSNSELRELMSMLRLNFSFTVGADCVIDIDPRTVDPVRLEALAQLGFNRLNFGVYDFDPEVQNALHRVQAATQVLELIKAARAVGFESIGVELMYGLPKQNPDSINRTLVQLIESRPERIALYGYSHSPARFKSQRQIDSAQVPDGSASIAIRARAMSVLLKAGYVYVGMDHFALPTDAVAKAKRQGRLHRSFQGYSPQADCDLIGLGVSSVSRIGASYSQNAKNLEEYYDLLDQGLFPVVGGIHLSRDDLIRRAVIMALICQGEVLFESIEVAHLVDFQDYFAAEIQALDDMVESGLVTVNDAAITLTSAGSLVMPAVAMIFDHYLQMDRARARFSKIY
jgi:oxygen-independent coproporphyrinogen-3 oxidase